MSPARFSGGGACWVWFCGAHVAEVKRSNNPPKNVGVVKRNFQTWLRKETDRKCGTSGYDINLLLIGLLVGLGLMSWFRVGARSSGQLKVCGGGSLLISVAEKKNNCSLPLTCLSRPLCQKASGPLVLLWNSLYSKRHCENVPVEVKKKVKSIQTKTHGSVEQ